MSMKLARERALQGAAWLDQVRPGWDEYINLTDLILESGYDCVLGQVFNEEASEHRAQEDYYSGYDWAIDNHEIGFGIELGFEQDRVSVFAEPKVSYDELDQAWTELIKARRAQRVAYASYAGNITAGLRSEALDARDCISEVVGDLMNENCVPCLDCTPRIITVADIARDLEFQP